jgi:hypothetical protein
MEAPMNDLGAEARSILDAGRDGDEPAPGDRARIRGAVLRAIAAGGASGAVTIAGEAAAGAKVAGGLTTGWKVFLCIAALGAVGGGAAGARHVLAAAPPNTSPSASPVAAPPAQTAAVVTTNVGAASTSPAPAPSPAVGDAEPAADPPARAAAAPRVNPTPIVVARAPQRDPVASPPIEAPAAIERTAAIEATAAAPPTAPAPPAPADADTLIDETRRLRDAHAAMKGGDPSRALSLLEEQSAVGPKLREERAAARVLALCQLGRVDEAKAAAGRFLAESPRSPLADRVRASCAGR